MKIPVLLPLAILGIAIFGISAGCNAEQQGAADKLPPKFVQALNAGKAQHLVVYGTSLTKGSAKHVGGPWVIAFKDALDARYPNLVTLTNAAKGGTSSAWGLKNIDSVIAAKPDAVFIEFAINDAVVRYAQSVESTRENVEGMITKIKAALPDCEIILQLMHQAAGEKSPREKQDEQQQVYRDLAQKHGLLLIDNATPWKEFIAKNGLDAFLKFAPDGVHMKLEGIKAVTLPNILKTLQIEAAK